jgi:protein TonB
MVRLATAFGIAVLIHAAVLFTDTRWPLRQPPRLANRQVLTMQLVARQPHRPPALRQLPKPPPPLPPEPPAAPQPTPQEPVVSKPVVAPKPMADKPQPAPTKPIVNHTPPPNVEAPAPEPVAAVDPPLETPLEPSHETTAETAVSTAAAESETSPAAEATVVMATPRYRDNPLPIYPRLARKRGIQGTVILEVFVEADGRVGGLRIAESSRHNMLDRAAEKTVRQWLFEPGREGQQAVAMWVRVPVDFRLQE